METTTVLVRLYHYYTRMPGGKRAHRYICADPEGTFWGVFWSRTEVYAWLCGHPSMAVAVSVQPCALPSYAKPIDWLEWNRHAAL